MDSQGNSTLRLPAIDGDFWHIGTYPDLGDLAYGPEHEVVDHAISQSNDPACRRP